MQLKPHVTNPENGVVLYIFILIWSSSCQCCWFLHFQSSKCKYQQPHSSLVLLSRGSFPWRISWWCSVWRLTLNTCKLFVSERLGSLTVLWGMQSSFGTRRLGQQWFTIKSSFAEQELLFKFISASFPQSNSFSHKCFPGGAAQDYYCYSATTKRKWEKDVWKWSMWECPSLVFLLKYGLPNPDACIQNKILYTVLYLNSPLKGGRGGKGSIPVPEKYKQSFMLVYKLHFTSKERNYFISQTVHPLLHPLSKWTSDLSTLPASQQQHRTLAAYSAVWNLCIIQTNPKTKYSSATPLLHWHVFLPLCFCHAKAGECPPQSACAKEVQHQPAKELCICQYPTLSAWCNKGCKAVKLLKSSIIDNRQIAAEEEQLLLGVFEGFGFFPTHEEKRENWWEMKFHLM